MTDASWIPLAVVTQPHGVSGRLKIKSFTEPATAFADYAALTDANGKPVKLKITGEAQGQVVVQIDGLTCREEAELWRGKQLGVDRSQMPEPEDDGQFYAADLIGMQVFTTENTAFGVVHDVVNYGAGDLLEITLTSGERELYAFTATNFPEQDMEARRITIDPPEYLGSRAEEEGAA